MTRLKKLGILLALLIVICLLTFFLSRYNEKQEEIKNSSDIILEIESGSVTKLSWENESGEYSFSYDGSWHYDADGEFPADADKISDMLSQFEAFGAAFIIEEVTDFAQYGLDDPVCTINIGTEGASYTLELGDYSAMDSQRYVSTGDGNVYLAAHDPLDEFGAVAEDLIDNCDNPVIDELVSIDFTGKEAYRAVYSEENTGSYCDDDVYFAEIGGASLPLDTSRVEKLISELKAVDMTDFVNYKASSDDLEGYGLSSPEAGITLSYREEDEEGELTDKAMTLYISRDPEEIKEAEAAGADDEGDDDDEDEEITAYLNVEGSGIVYSINPSSYKVLTAITYNDLRHSEVLPASKEAINKLEISLEGEDYTFTRETEADDDNPYGTWSCGGDDADVSGIIDALLKVSAANSSKFTQDAADGKLEIALKVYLDNENFPEIDISLYRHDGEDCLAVVQSESFAYVGRSQVVSLIEAVNSVILGSAG